VDGSATRALGNFSYAKDDGAARKTPPKLSLSGAPSGVELPVGWASPPSLLSRGTLCGNGAIRNR
jgi:hypothetical protein